MASLKHRNIQSVLESHECLKVMRRSKWRITSMVLSFVKADIHLVGLQLSEMARTINSVVLLLKRNTSPAVSDFPCWHILHEEADQDKLSQKSLLQWVKISENISVKTNPLFWYYLWFFNAFLKMNYNSILVVFIVSGRVYHSHAGFNLPGHTQGGTMQSASFTVIKSLENYTTSSLKQRKFVWLCCKRIHQLLFCRKSAARGVLAVLLNHCNHTTRTEILRTVSSDCAWKHFPWEKWGITVWTSSCSAHKTCICI